MGFVELRGDTDRYFLLLTNPKKVYNNQIEGSTKRRVDNQIEKFLTEPTPQSALQDENKFSGPTRQLKDRGGKVRALGVWCQGEGYDLFITQALFDKDDENKIYSEIKEFRRRGSDLKSNFSGLTHKEICDKADEWRDRDDLLLFTPVGCP